MSIKLSDKEAAELLEVLMVSFEMTKGAIMSDQFEGLSNDMQSKLAEHAAVCKKLYESLQNSVLSDVDRSKFN